MLLEDLKRLQNFVNYADVSNHETILVIHNNVIQSIDVINILFMIQL